MKRICVWRSSVTIRAGLCAFLAWCLTGTMLAQTFVVNIPQKVPAGATPPIAGPFQVATAKFTISVVAPNAATTITGVTFTIASNDQALPWTAGPFNESSFPDGSCVNDPTSSVVPIACSGGTFTTPPPFGGITPVRGDIVTISRPFPEFDSSRYQRYEINFQLLSNYSPACTGTQQFNPDSYTVTVNAATSGGAATISAGCLESYDPLSRIVSSVASCVTGGLQFSVPAAETSAVLASPLAPPQCFKQRPGVDLVLVLDKSGSMASPALGSNPRSKMAALRAALKDFVDTWNSVRTADPVPGPPDKIGVVLFDTSTTWWHDGGLSDGLHSFPDSIIAGNAASCDPGGSCGALVPGGLTAIGAALNLGDSASGLGSPALSGDGNRHLMLLMTDGMQNVAPLVGASRPGPAIHVVTVGTGIAIQPAIIQQLAHNTGGFYINTEDNPELLRPLFLEMLQNILRFNSYETVRMVSRAVTPAAPFTATLPLSTTSRDAEFSLMWPSGLGSLRLTVTPPGAPPIVQESNSGFISVVRQLPLPAPFNPAGSWRVVVEALRRDVSSGRGEIPFDLHIMADDSTIKSELSVVPGDYTPGDSIRLRAKVTQNGRPVRDVGAGSGDKMIVEVVRPGRSIGDLLSDSTASATPPTATPDIQPGAAAKLFNTLQGRQASLVRDQDTVTLFDDGRPEHGDDTADDGVYNALYRTRLAGHYNFLFGVEGTAPSGDRFSRQQLRTAFVRPVPAAGGTVFQTSVTRDVLSIVMTPRTRSGDRMGPGWGNYFWFTAPGQAPFKATDNLDGTYTATLAFSGAQPPAVSAHFENVVALIEDSATPGALPVPLGPATVLVDDVRERSRRFAFSLAAGTNIPHTSFAAGFDSGFSVNGGLEYLVFSHVSLEAVAGYHHFRGPAGRDQNVGQFSLHTKIYATGGGVRPFVTAGAGAYTFRSGAAHFGGTLGTGVLYEWTPRFGLTASYNLHVTNTPTNTRFSTIQLGLRTAF